MNNLDQAEEHYHQAEEVFNQYANIHGRALLLSNMGLNLTQQGKRRKAKAYLDEALSLWQTLNDKYSEIQGMIYLLNYELALGHQAKAVVRLAQTERQLQETDPNQRYLLLRQQINEIRRSLSK
jgi:tetratricopeptide (TPR) repeat protein